jgi:cobalt-zinc-cadmium efflux system outer membrane protein
MSNTLSRRAGRAILLTLCSLAATATPAAQPSWTLDEAIARALELAPESRAEAAGIDAATGLAEQAGRWPNPRLGIATSDRIGKELGNGGIGLSEITIDQAIPIGGRLRHAREAQQARLGEARANARLMLLELEHTVSLAFHALQFEAARLRLAEAFLAEARGFQRIARVRAEAGDISTLERLRLDLTAEQAHQSIKDAEGGFEDALAGLRPYLGIKADIPLTVAVLAAPATPSTLEELTIALPEHPRWQASQERVAFTGAQVQAARAARMQDWEIGLSVEREVFDGREDEATTLGLRIPIPLWDQRSGAVGAARAETNRATAEQQAVQRDLDAGLRKTHDHLRHLTDQAEHHRRAVLRPAQLVFELSSAGFAAGEIELLALIDATDTYFDERERRLELLHASQREAAALRLAAGRSLLDASNPPGGH